MLKFSVYKYIILNNRGGGILFKKINKSRIGIVCIMLTICMVINSFSVCAFAKESYISEVTLATGANARTNLEKSGYSVMFQGLNLVTDDNKSSMVYLGYKKGSNAITDFIVSDKKESSIASNGHTYNLVADVNLNNGTSGSAIYLYCTSDSSAGEGITSLDTVSGFTSEDSVVSLRNDGSSPVRTDDGKLANFDKGISNNELYLLMYRESSIKQYISNVCMVTASTKAKALNSAASKGCDYYLDKDISDSNNNVTYIAYQRTADQTQAVTELGIDGDDVKLSRDGKSGAYLLDISNGKLFNDSFTLGDWAGIYAATNKSISKTSSEYKSFAKSKDECSCVSAGDRKIYGIYLGTANVSVPEETTQATTEQESTTVEEVTDEYLDIEKEETTEATTEEETEGDKSGSVISSGNIKAIIVFLVIIVLVVVGLLIYKKKGKKKNEEND